MQRFARSWSMPAWLLGLVLLYAVASLVHFTHNAEFLADYPGLPDWLARSHVYGAWLAVTAVGLAGLVTWRFGLPRLGFGLMVAYAVLGFAGLDHYWAAPLSAHSPAMNLTIWFEVAAASALLAGLLLHVFQPGKQSRP